ncbi:NlpC/P60 family protein [Streptomyces sp. CSDS2]|uniref:C40 family peptidase n=1 Tax=Streptomyces sp. CSDS2 TaxID=3055051 RepID=UPI0025AFEF9C|nr:C40 family peptidase [Streptomyces sp. CSDS2]MDN3265120.1 NlpC/P60 family protein [Streptomyces sp. CSDS2]
MASHRKPRPGGSRPAVVHTPAPAAAPTSTAAVSSQPAESALTAGQDIPTPEEVARKIDDFYRQAESALAASGEGSGAGEWRGRGVRTARDGRGERSGGGERYGGTRDERARRADAAGGGPRAAGAGQGGGAGWKGRPEPAGWSEWAERAKIPRAAEGSLQRLRDEVARRARQRTLPGARGMVPAQRGTGQSGPGTTRTEPGISQAGPGTGQAERLTEQSARRVRHTGHDTSPAEPCADEPQGGTDLTGPGTSGPATPGISHAKFGIGHTTRDTGHTTRMTDHAARGAGKVSRSTGVVGHATIPAGSPAALAPPHRTTAPPQAMKAPPPAQETVGVAVPTGRRPGTPARRPDTTGGGPKAAKVVSREKLTHARVLLSQRIARAPGTPWGTYATKAGEAVAFARAQLGKPCVWGAAGPGSYDCAGLTQAAWKSAGVTLPRTAPEQAGVGIPVPSAEARPGDLVFFRDDAGHVGLCTGDGMMIHAPRPGAYVREEPVSALGEAAVHSVVRPG